MASEDAAQFRRFSRMFTRLIGTLDACYLSRVLGKLERGGLIGWPRNGCKSPRVVRHG